MDTAAELLARLESQAGVARRILEALNEQHRALQELDLAGLELSSAALEKEAGAMREADEARAQASGALAAALGLPARTPLRELLPALDAGAETRSALEAVRAELKELMEEMHQRNYANFMLILNAARYNRALLRFISGTSTTYSRDGAAGETGEGASVVLNKKA